MVVRRIAGLGVGIDLDKHWLELTPAVSVQDSGNPMMLLSVWFRRQGEIPDVGFVADRVQALGIRGESDVAASSDRVQDSSAPPAEAMADMAPYYGAMSDGIERGCGVAADPTMSRFYISPDTMDFCQKGELLETLLTMSERRCLLRMRVA